MATSDVTTNKFIRLVDWTAMSDRLKPADRPQRQSDVVNELIETHLPQVYRFALHLLKNHHAAQDVAQEAILRAWRDRKKIRKQESARAWLLKITGNLCRDYQRRAAHPVSRAEEITSEPPGNIFGPLENVIHHEQQKRVAQIISELPPRERTSLYLSAFEQLSNSEIASVMQISDGAAKVALSRARKTVRQRLVEEETTTDEDLRLHR